MSHTLKKGFNYERYDILKKIIILCAYSEYFIIKTQNNRQAENIRPFFLQYLTYSGTNFLTQSHVLGDYITSLGNNICSALRNSRFLSQSPRAVPRPQSMSFRHFSFCLAPEKAQPCLATAKHTRCQQISIWSWSPLTEYLEEWRVGR